MFEGRHASRCMSFLRDINEMVNSAVMATKNSCDEKPRGLHTMPSTRSLILKLIFLATIEVMCFQYHPKPSHQILLANPINRPAT